MLIDVFESPPPFRIDLAGADVANWYGGTIGNRFLDEMDPHASFDELTLQCRATVKRCAPTYHETVAGKRGAEHPSGYARLLLPLWGNGRMEMVLGGVVPVKATRKKHGLD